ncbi:MAG: 4-hydroxy-3-methylbut-2-enyl diphosphate reductase [Sulfurovum sp.]|nr:4-hydroxy-3-methylbut-2-enyl diphosphate reductase [Sulfurovum sp.]MCB4745219.1 4-hydroxy-3-methylbut-2-enyl diphosphate reductase [Sulfurovum sp.]MCB4745732.1 4-hydroxy-3-methylbut-2-enyl diphosphate reductase [Sulfurovum sp.]MCB4748100.1 4-hydroxy-3-methylbut-2-enyl diphosphate reductase [Sulfurovum sp.]MCB4749772.1 4-hydroxy-3-methylbut-2-enyl diphosphate reductase [Sulfurovum sp.]
MKIQLASNYGFCFGVKRAIKIAEEHQGSKTYGPLIHNKDEINRLKEGFQIGLAENLDEITPEDSVVIRTHGIPKDELAKLNIQNNQIIDATCPYVTTPQNIVAEMSKKGYSIVVFGDKNHPEIKGVVSYAKDPRNAFVVIDENELEGLPILSKVAVVAQTTRKPKDYLKVVNKLILEHKEVRVFNTICNATFENQDAAAVLAKDADVMIVIGGKHSSNTKQLHSICKTYCGDSYLIENQDELRLVWFKNKELCGISAGASTPDWIVQNVIEKIQELVQKAEVLKSE